MFLLSKPRTTLWAGSRHLGCHGTMFRKHWFITFQHTLVYKLLHYALPLYTMYDWLWPGPDNIGRSHPKQLQPQWSVTWRRWTTEALRNGWWRWGWWYGQQTHPGAIQSRGTRDAGQSRQRQPRQWWWESNACGHGPSIGQLTCAQS